MDGLHSALGIKLSADVAPDSHETHLVKHRSKREASQVLRIAHKCERTTRALHSVNNWSSLFQSLISNIANSRHISVSVEKCKEFGAWYSNYCRAQTGTPSRQKAPVTFFRISGELLSRQCTVV